MFYFDNQTLMEYLQTYQRLMIYVNKEYLTITNTSDISDTEFGSGIDVTGKTIPFSYKEIELVKVGSTIFTLDMLQKSKEPKEEQPEKTDKDSEKPTPEKGSDKKQKESIEYNSYIKNIDRSSRHYGTTGAVQLVLEDFVTYKTYIDGGYQPVTIPLKFAELMEIIEWKG